MVCDTAVLALTFCSSGDYRQPGGNGSYQDSPPKRRLCALCLGLTSVGVLSQKLLLYDAIGCRFQTVKLRGRNPNCAICGDNPTIHELLDYELMCNMKANDGPQMLAIMPPECTISCRVRLHNSDTDSSRISKTSSKQGDPICSWMCELLYNMTFVN